MEKTSNLFKKTGRYQGNIVISSRKLGDTKGIFHSKMGTIKDRNGKDLTKAEGIRRGGKNTQKNYTIKVLMTQITMMM